MIRGPSSWNEFARYFDPALGHVPGMLEYLKSRVLFRTEGGYLGIGPLLTRPGDVVAVFPEMQTPFVLRKTRNCFGRFYSRSYLYSRPY